MIYRWSANMLGEKATKKKPGRPVNERFEACVIERLIMLKLTELDSSGKKIGSTKDYLQRRRPTCTLVH